MHGHLIAMHIKGHIGGMEEVVGEVLLDDVTLVSATDDEVVDTVLRVNLQNVPENRTPANLHHRLGTNYRFFRETRADAASEDDCFHGLDGLLRWLLHRGRQRHWLPTSRPSITCRGSPFSTASRYRIRSRGGSCRHFSFVMLAFSILMSMSERAEQLRKQILALTAEYHA